MLLSGIFLEYPIAVPIIAWFCAQAVKMGLRMLAPIKHQNIWGSGGMPSVHSTFVMALSTVIAMKYGMKSAEFTISLSFAGIVLYDAMHVRYQTGQQGKILNTLTALSPIKEHLPTTTSFYEHVGHTPLEVTVGGVLGITIALLLSCY